MKPKDILHYPRLDTVLMVEKFIYNNSGEFKKNLSGSICQNK